MKNNDLNILIIDDDKIVTFLIQTMVEKYLPGKTVYTFPDGKSALEFLEDRPDDHCLLLLDLNMPVMGGEEFLERLDHSSRETSNVTTTIVTSSIDERDKKIRNRYRHIIDFLEKPVSRERLKNLAVHPRLKGYWQS